MPELPEVEATRRHLEPILVGRRIEQVSVHRERMIRRQHRPADFAIRLSGRRLERLDRIGKFILGRVEEDLTWVMHLGMSGRMQIARSDAIAEPHSNVHVAFSGGDELRFVDPRTFGFMAVFTPEEFDASSLADLGPDALESLPTATVLAEVLSGRTAPIKALLLDQRILAGLGNIYADEVLHRSKVAPHRPGGSLDFDEVAAVRSAIRPILRAGLKAGGTSLDDLAYLLPDGRAGDYLARLAVYGRAGKPCRRCGSEIESAVLRGRTTHWCRVCQR
jgi:formamidopyrimidine-DNA glycosylase